MLNFRYPQIFFYKKDVFMHIKKIIIVSVLIKTTSVYAASLNALAPWLNPVTLSCRQLVAAPLRKLALGGYAVSLYKEQERAKAKNPEDQRDACTLRTETLKSIGPKQYRDLSVYSAIFTTWHWPTDAYLVRHVMVHTMNPFDSVRLDQHYSLNILQACIDGFYANKDSDAQEKDFPLDTLAYMLARMPYHQKCLTSSHGIPSFLEQVKNANFSNRHEALGYIFSYMQARNQIEDRSDKNSNPRTGL